MLVLTRKLQESIMIGDDIEIHVLDIDGEQIKLGIHAPRHIEVHRKEIYLSIQEENKQATNNPMTSDVINQLKQLKKL